MVVNLTVKESAAKKALENPGGDRLLAQWGGEQSGLPYYAFLDQYGKKIADSNAMPGDGNIGYPATPEEITAFSTLLEKTAPRMTREQRDEIASHLSKSAPRPTTPSRPNPDIAAGNRFGSAWSRIAPFFTAPEAYRNDLGKLPVTLRFRDGRPVKSAADWKERRKELLTDWHAILGPWPPLIDKPAITYLAKEQVENFTRHKVSIEIAPGRTTEAFLLIPDGKGPFPAVVDVFYQPLDGAGLNPERRNQNDFGYQLAKRGFAALCVGQQPWLKGPIYYPSVERAQLQPLSYLAYVAANCHTILARLPEVDPERIGVVGHSYGGKWSLFAGALYEKFACVVLSDPGIVFDESRPNVNYWEPWYLGYEAGKEPRKAGVPTDSNPRTGPYKRLIETGRDLNELLVLIAPRPFFLAGGSEDPASRWQAINHLAAVNSLLGFEQRAGMSTRPDHQISPEASEQICLVFQQFLGRR